MATDMRKRLPHQPRNVQELAGAAQEAWKTWHDGPRGSAEHEEAMTQLGVALGAFALGPADPRYAPPVPNVRVKLP